MENINKNTSSRRLFLLAGAVALVGTCLPHTVNAAKNAQRFAMIIDLNRCIGCQSCVLACKGAHPTQEFRTQIVIGENSKKPAVTFTPVQCNQCSPAKCVESCKTKALAYEANGVVSLNTRRCVGCGECVTACSYHAISQNPETKKADKCDFCFDQQGIPACVEACASHARLFGDMNHATGDFAQALSNPSLQSLDTNSTEHVQVFYIPLNS